jgi:hypothetical protein
VSGPSNGLATPGVVLGWQAQQEAEARAKVAGGPVEDHRSHETELLAAHGGAPSVAEQSATHGAALPAPDHGTADREKYQ